MDYRMEELIPIVADLAKQYAGCDSTSITYENAQELMQGVIFCLDEYWNSEPNHLCSGIFPLWNNIRQVHSLCWKK